MRRFRGVFIAPILALIIGILVPASGAARTMAKARARDKKVIIGYIFPRKGRLPDEAIKGEWLTHINYAFANIKNGQLVTERPDDAANIKALTDLKKPFPHLKVLISVGGWSWSGGFSDISLTKASRREFINSAIHFLQQNKLDGIDIDWEYPGLPGAGNKHRQADRRNFTLLLAELRKALNSAGKQAGATYLLTIAAGASQSFLQHTEMGKAQKYLDYVNLMTYDFFVGAGGKSGHHSNLHPSSFRSDAPSGAASVAAFLRAGVPAQKLVLGVPFYGRGWKGAKSESNGLYQAAEGAEGNYPWSNLTHSFIDRNGYTRWWDTEAKAPYLWKPDEGRVVTYDDPDSLKEKCSFVKKSNLGGVMFWEYSEDDPEHTLLRTLHENLQDYR